MVPKGPLKEEERIMDICLGISCWNERKAKMIVNGLIEKAEEAQMEINKLIGDMRNLMLKVVRNEKRKDTFHLIKVKARNKGKEKGYAKKNV